MKVLIARAKVLVPRFGAHRSVRLLTALAKLKFNESIDLTDLTQSLAESLQLLHGRMGAQEIGISAWALATLRPAGWKKLLGRLVARAADESVMPELNWWSVAHLEFAIRVALDESPDCRALTTAPAFLRTLTPRCEEELEQIQEASRSFQEAPLVAAAAHQPWQHMPEISGARSALLFGPARHVRRALQRSGFEVTQWYRFAVGNKPAEPWPPAGDYNAAAIRYPDSYEAVEYALHAIAASLPPGAPAWVYGDVHEGVLSTTRAIKGLFRLVAMHEAGDARVLSLKRTQGQARASLEAWFKQEAVSICEATRTWWSMPGLFAGGFVDVMSNFLLTTIANVASVDDLSEKPLWLRTSDCKVMDFASGTGVLAAGVQSTLPGNSEMWLIDSDSVALQAAQKNLPDAHIILADGLQGVRTSGAAPQSCHLIVSNPPVHQGHTYDLRVLVELLQEAPLWLQADGELWLVTQERIPTGRLFDMVLQSGAKLKDACTITTYPTNDGRFVVWRARYSKSVASSSGRKRKHVEVGDGDADEALRQQSLSKKGMLLCS